MLHFQSVATGISHIFFGSYLEIRAAYIEKVAGKCGSNETSSVSLSLKVLSFGGMASPLDGQRIY